MSLIAEGAIFKVGGDLELIRMGYGAMQLTGPGAWGPPRDRSGAIEVLRAAIDGGVNHIDTSDYYGPYVVNELIREALYPYPDELCIVTKVGARRDHDQSWPPALARHELIAAVHQNLAHLGLDTLDIVNLRVGHAVPVPGSIAEPFAVLAELRDSGLIRHLGVSNVTIDQLIEALQIAPVVCVQNRYNLLQRGDDTLVGLCAASGIAYTSYSTLDADPGPKQSEVLASLAGQLGASPRQIALAWLLQRSPNILVIPGTASVAHLQLNIAAAALELPAKVVAQLDTLGA